MRRFYLHIGPHKTGTKSFQDYLAQHASWFADNGMTCIYDMHTSEKQKHHGPRINYHCKGIAHLCVRPDFDAPKRQDGTYANHSWDEKLHEIEQINAQFHQMEGETLLMSCEAFSFIRTAKEMRAVRLLTKGFDLQPIAVFRERNNWMESWINHLDRHNFLEKTGAPEGIGTADFGTHSWLTDWDDIKDLYGAEGIYLSFEDALTRYGSVVPAILDCLPLPTQSRPDWGTFWRNAAEKPLGSAARLRKAP